MSLWFKKKTEKDEAATSPKVENAANTSAPAAEHRPVVPQRPSVHLTPKPPISFKLPQTSAPASPAPAGDVREQAAPSPNRAASSIPAPPPPALAQTAPAKTSPAPGLGGVASGEAKPVLKPVEGRAGEQKPAITVADRSAVVSEKSEPIAADRPALPRSDPKVLYYQLMNGLYDVVFVLDDSGNVIDCNSRAEEIFGYSADDVWNMPVDRLVYGMNNRMFNLLRKNLGNKRHILIDARCFRSNGTSFLAEVGVSTIQLTRSESVVFAIRNVERRKDSAEELRKARAALDTLPFPAFTCNLHGEFEVVNPPVLKALGMVDAMEAQKKHFSEMLPDMVECFQAAVRGEDVAESRQLTRPDGTAYTLELRLKPMRRGQEITGVAGSMVML